MGGRSKSQSTTPTRYNAIQINQSAYGNCVPLLYGTNRLPIQLIDYTDFKSVPQKQQSAGKGGGSQTTTGFSYSATLVGLLCEGKITGVSNVFVSKAVHTLAQQNMTLFAGAGSQAPWLYLQSTHPSEALAYDHMAYIGAANYSLGSSAGLPNLTFETTGLLPWPGFGAAGALLDAEPSQIIIDYLSDPNHGAGFPYVTDLTTGPTSYQQYCVAMGFFLSPLEDTQRQAVNFLQEILQITNSNAVWSPAVGLRVVPYGDTAISGNNATYTPNLVPIYSFSDSDYLVPPNDTSTPPVQRSITPANQTFNVWRVEYVDRLNQYNTAIAEYRDEQDIAINGLRINSTVSLHQITSAPVASTVAALLCQRNIYIRSTFTFKVRMDFSLLEPMDLVAINDSTAGISNQLVRIIKTEDDANDVFTITAEEMLVGPAHAPLYDTQLAASFAANYNEDPGPITAPYIFTAPPMLIGDTGGYEIWIAAGSSGAMWGGAIVYASTDNVSYTRVGVITNAIQPARYGTITGALPAGGDPDTSNIINVQLISGGAVSIVSGTRANADNLVTLCIVDGEIIAYQNATALGNNAFALSYLRRGKYQSPNTLHAAGSKFAILDDGIFRMGFPPGLAGQPVWFKFQSFNIFGGGVEDLASLSSYQAFFQGQNGGVLESAGATPLIARNACVVVGNSIYKKPNSSSAWDSDCYSQDAFASGLTCKFNACQTNSAFMIGINSDPTTDESFASLDHAWHPSIDGHAYIYENGKLTVSTGVFYTTSTLFEIRYDSKFVSYYLDGVLWRSVPDPGKVFFLDSSFYTPGAAAQNVYFGALNPANSSPFVARGNCSVSNEVISKPSGTGGGWDSDCYSLEGYPTCHVTAKVSSLGLSQMFGFTKSPQNAPSTTNVSYGFYPGNNGHNWYIVEGGTVIGSFGTPSTTDIMQIAYDGSNVSYYINTILVHKTATVGLTLFGYCLFGDIGAAFNTFEFGPTTSLSIVDTGQISSNAATMIFTINEFQGGIEQFSLSANASAGAGGISTLTAPQVTCDVIITAIIPCAQGGGNVGDVTYQLEFYDVYSPGNSVFVNGPTQLSPVLGALPVKTFTPNVDYAGSSFVVLRYTFTHVPYSQSGLTYPVTVPISETSSSVATAFMTNNKSTAANVQIGGGGGSITFTLEYILR